MIGIVINICKVHFNIINAMYLAKLPNNHPLLYETCIFPFIYKNYCTSPGGPHPRKQSLPQPQLEIQHTDVYLLIDKIGESIINCSFGFTVIKGNVSAFVPIQ